MIPEVEIYSDGGAEPNPGKGGFGVIMSYKGQKKEFSQGYRLTTNNRMELMGVIFALERLKRTCKVNVYTDSQYVVNGINLGWAKKWQKNNWFRKGNKKAINYDLWEKLLNLIAQQESVNFYWIKGHAGHSENERCDELANLALNGETLIEDFGYNENTENSTLIDSQSKFEHNKPNEVKSTKKKILFEGDNCRKCNEPVIKKTTKSKELKPNQTYYYEYYLFCPKCATIYMVDEAKRFITD